MGGYDPKGREIVLALVRVMSYLGASFGVLRKEKCTGDPVRRLGNDLVFQQLAEANLEALKQNKVKKIVTICPHCVRTIQEDWKEYGTPPEVEHHSEFLARFADRLSLAHEFSSIENAGKNEGALAPEEKIVFHDPCYLGRYRGVYEEPRKVAALAGELVEAPRSRERSFCCGAGGGLVFLGEETGERVSHVRAAELAATGAGTVAAACPFCNTMFRDALADRGEGAPELLDIAQLAARGLPE
jgi:Fe-S oxidoreductase